MKKLFILLSISSFFNVFADQIDMKYSFCNINNSKYNKISPNIYAHKESILKRINTKISKPTSEDVDKYLKFKINLTDALSVLGFELDSGENHKQRFLYIDSKYKSHSVIFIGISSEEIVNIVDCLSSYGVTQEILENNWK